MLVCLGENEDWSVCREWDEVVEVDLAGDLSSGSGRGFSFIEVYLSHHFSGTFSHSLQWRLIYKRWLFFGAGTCRDFHHFPLLMQGLASLCQLVQPSAYLVSLIP